MQNECDRFLVDSNILIYLADHKDKTKHEAAISFISSLNKEIVFISAQCLREFSSNCLVKKIIPSEIIIDFIESFVSKMIVIQDDYSDNINAVKLSKTNPSIFWDANIVSVMLRNEIDCIYTENVKDFQKLGVKAINPLK